MTIRFVGVNASKHPWLLSDKSKKDLYLTEMKTTTLKLFTLILFGLKSSLGYAHCPANFTGDKVCFMLDTNLLYIYDHKLEHNGPYKDLKMGLLMSIKDKNESDLVFKKIARGIYKIESKTDLKSVELTIVANKKTHKITVAHE